MAIVDDFSMGADVVALWWCSEITQLLLCVLQNLDEMLHHAHTHAHIIDVELSVPPISIVSSEYIFSFEMNKFPNCNNNVTMVRAVCAVHFHNLLCLMSTLRL